MSHRLLPFSPEAYHGKPSSRPYFEGWYFKQSCKDGAFVAIPGVYRGTDSSKDFAFIQIICGASPKSHFLSFPIHDFFCDLKEFNLRIGRNQFSVQELILNLPEIGLSAELRFSRHIFLKTNLISPSIMGPFSYLPGMQCNHGVLSMWHSVTGIVNNKEYSLNFNDADGYIEKDWGEEFPESWIWMQCGGGKEALFCAVARIPFKRMRFTGLIAVLQSQEGQLRFATYNGSKIIGISKRDGGITVEVKKGQFRLCIIARNTTYGKLLAPSKDGMNREIEESVDCTYDISVCFGTQTIYSGHFEHGGLELLNPEMLVIKNNEISEN